MPQFCSNYFTQRDQVRLLKVEPGLRRSHGVSVFNERIRVFESSLLLWGEKL